MAKARHPLDHLHLTPQERRTELVKILAEALLRLGLKGTNSLACHPGKLPEKTVLSGLACAGEPSVHGHGG